MTGLYPHQAGVGGMVDWKRGDVHLEGPYQGWLNDRCVTIAEVLKNAGYHALMAGKWHVGETKPHWPTDRGFDRYYGLISGAANYFDITKANSKCAFRRFAIDNKLHTPRDDDFCMTTAFTDNALKYIDRYGPDDKPFFMYLAYTAPHWPLHALPEDIEKHRGNCAIRQGKWKLVREAGSYNWQLYDLKADRTELNNLIDKYPEKVRKMKNLYKNWALKVGSTRHKVWLDKKDLW